MYLHNKRLKISKG